MKSDPHLDISGCRGRRTKSTWAVVLLWASLAVAPVAQAADTGRIIVTNARLAGRDASAQDVPVNLLIVGGQLAVVTKDELVIQPGDVAVDASAGYLFGRLVLGSHPSFVILDGDPRKDADVILDTKAHTRFAMRDGEIVKNELPALSPSPPDATPRPRRWRAYTPPPIAVPIRSVVRVHDEDRQLHRADTARRHPEDPHTLRARRRAPARPAAGTAAADPRTPLRK